MQLPNRRYRKDKSTNVQNNANARIRECKRIDIPTVANVFQIPLIPDVAEWSANEAYGNGKNNKCHSINENEGPKNASESPIREEA